MVNALKKMVAAIQALSAADFRQGAATVTERLKQDDGEMAVRERASHVERCPHCHSTAWGKGGLGRARLPAALRRRCSAFPTISPNADGVTFPRKCVRSSLNFIDW